MTAVRSGDHPLLLGEWACLGILAPLPAHGFAVAARLRPDGDIGRVWSLSRALTYRSLDQLRFRGHIRQIGEEPGVAGGNRTILAITPIGDVELRRWLDTPVVHLRDLRSELLLKLVLAEWCRVDVSSMLRRQRERTMEAAAKLDASLADGETVDVVTLWRTESAQAALRFLDRLGRW